MKYNHIHNQYKACRIKWKNVLVLSLLIVATCSCDSAFPPIDIEEPEIPVDTAYLSLGIDLNTYHLTRAYEGEAYGTPEENFVQKVRLVLYDGDQPTSKVVKTFDYDIRTNTDGTTAWTDQSSQGKDLAPTTSQNDKTKFITYARKVPMTDLKMLVIINTTPQLKTLTQEGTIYHALTQAVKIENNPTKTDNIAGLAQPNHFLMTSGPGLITIPQNKLKATLREAHNDPVTATVARIVSKITLISPDGSDTLPTNTNAAVADIQWELDITNRHTYWMAKGTPNPDRSQWYWEDPNYTGYAALSFTQREQQFFYFQSLADPYPTFKKRIKQSEYCLENTMDETDQKSDNIITRALIRCTYKPVNVKKTGDGFYVYNGQTHSLDEMKEYASEAEKLPPSLITGIYKAIKEANTQEGYTFLTGTPYKNNQEVKEPFHTQGITYYYKGINYYAVKIRHRGTNDLNPGYAHYGVLRNTHYTITIDHIDGPGSPGILWDEITTRTAGSDHQPDNPHYNNIQTSIQAQ